jgi:hypothetical protein
VLIEVNGGGTTSMGYEVNTHSLGYAGRLSVLMLFLLCLVQEIDEVVFPDRGESMGAMAPSGV